MKRKVTSDFHPKLTTTMLGEKQYFVEDSTSSPRRLKPTTKVRKFERHRHNFAPPKHIEDIIVGNKHNKTNEKLISRQQKTKLLKREMARNELFGRQRINTKALYPIRGVSSNFTASISSIKNNRKIANVPQREEITQRA